MNITDIDNKIISRLPEQTLESLLEYTSYYTDKFIEDIHKLGIVNYDKDNIHKVTDTIDQIEDMIIVLIDKGCAYKVNNGSVYFDSLSSIKNPFHNKCDSTTYESTRNIIRDEGIKNNSDFVLWKVKENRQLSFGKKLQAGTPGWHIECSAIANQILDKVHIKMGAMDLKLLHHKCEIYQSESYKQKQIYGDYWLHFGFLNFGGDKMSKSIGNIKRLDDITYNHKLLRLYLLSKSYKNDFEYNEEEIELMKKDFINLHLLHNKLLNKFYKTHTNSKLNYTSDTDIYQEILNTVSNNLDTKSGFILLFNYINKIMKVYLDEVQATKILNDLYKVNKLFNIIDKKILEIDDKTMNIINEREELRVLKQFTKTDEMRTQIQQNFIFEDDNSGFSLIKQIN